MKKTKRAKKLRLDSATIKPLTSTTLGQAAGGRIIAFSEADSCTCKCGDGGSEACA